MDSAERNAVDPPPAGQIAARLRRYNEWRRGADIPQPSPSEIGADIDAAADALDDLTALVVRLARSLKKHNPDNDLADKAMDYLAANKLQGSPLRGRG